MDTNEKLLNGLNEARRDALVPYYLHHVIPTRGLGALAQRIKTPEDLYEYLLLDPQVSAKVKTSRIAEAVASIQLYLHRCREQLEPEVDKDAMAQASRPEEHGIFPLWDAYNKRYATWAGLQRLLHYPASYLDPELRYRKTSLFRELEDMLNQGRITEDRVEQAFTQYVSSLRSILQLRVVSGYQTEPMLDKKGAIYFCGASPEAPNEYYWRKVDSSDWSGNPAPVSNPMGWSEWRKIEAVLQPAPGTVPAIVFFDHRLHVLCLYQRSDGVEGTRLGARARKDQDPDWVQPEQTFVWELQFATLSPSGQWRLRTWPLQQLIPGLDKPARVFACELRHPTEPLTLGVFFKTADMAGKPLLCRFNHLFERLDAPNWQFNFRHQDTVDTNFHDIQIFQPLKVTPATGGPTMKVPDNFRIPAGSFFEASSFDLVANGNNCSLSVTITSNLNGEADFHSRCLAGNETPLYSNPVKFQYQETKNATFIIPIAYDTVAGDFAYTIGLGFVYANIPVFAPIPLERFSPEVPVDFYKPAASLWVRTAHNALGASQKLLFFDNGAGGFWEFHYVLTTLGGALLERKMLEGLDHLLSWGVQQLLIDPENDAGTDVKRKLPFEGGVGLYMWELFFHAPFLVASRLLNEQRFDEAEAWFRRIFSPAGYRTPTGELEMAGAIPRYWNVRPLQEDSTWNSSMPIGTDDPDLIAAADPMHYKLAVYLRWLDLLMARGDQAYRQQTRDSLVEAKMWYVQVLQLLGPRPAIPTTLQWPEPTLQQAADQSSPLLRWLEQWVDAPPDALPPALSPGLPDQIGILDSPFKAPVNDAVLAYWDRAETRLSNLRHNLSIDGQPLTLPLFEPPVSPTALQHARQAGDAAGGGGNAGALPLWAQRFTVLLERARQAVQQVIQFGSALQGILERRDADALNVLQQTQQTVLLALAQSGQADNLRSQEHSLKALRESRSSADDRRKHFDALYKEHISRREEDALTLLSQAVDKRKAARDFRGVASAADMVPISWTGGTSFGLGLTTFGNVARIPADNNEVAALERENDSRKLETSEQYRRRQQDWQLQRDQAEHELRQLDAQIDATQAQIDMARHQIAQTEREQAYSQAVLDVLTTRFSGQTLFNWLAGRMATLYYQVYDAASSLCAQTQRSYAWETDDTRPYLRPGQWNDVYQGLMAGEGLLLSLQQMENAYLAWDRRCLEVRKTVSLEELSEKTMSATVRQLLEGTMAQSASPVTVELEDGTLTIAFALDIDGDYPKSLGEKRLIKTISISLPALLGPYQDVLAVLHYTSASPIPPEGCKAIALSHGLNDSGQFQLDFNDGKYLPFEGLPVHGAQFALQFPHAAGKQKAMLLSLTDAIVHVSYTIRS
jgi:hypothetical protein